MYEDEARAVASDLLSGNNTAVRGRLAQSLLESAELSEANLRQVLERAVAKVGQPVAVGEPSSFVTVLLPIDFERGKAQLRVSFGHQGELVGLLLTPSW